MHYIKNKSNQDKTHHFTIISLHFFTLYWRRKWQPTPVFLPGESHGQRSLVGCSPWGHAESDTTEATWQQQLSMLLRLFMSIESVW